MMRALVLVTVLGLAGCGRSPASLGITGPGAPPPAPTNDDSTITNPGITDPAGYGPSVGPAPSNQRYFNYN
jgi:hypothetical protein